jgi:hypothetical protein
MSVLKQIRSVMAVMYLLVLDYYAQECIRQMFANSDFAIGFI